MTHIIHIGGEQMTKIEEAQAKVETAQTELRDLQQKRLEVMRALADAERDPLDPTAQSRLQSAVAAVHEIDQALGRQKKEIRKAETELAETRASARRLAREVVQVEADWVPRFAILADLERVSAELAKLTAYPMDWPEMRETAQRLRGLVLSAKRQRQGLANGKRGLAMLGDGGDGLTDEQRERWTGLGYDYGYRLQIEKSAAHIQDSQAELAAIEVSDG